MCATSHTSFSKSHIISKDIQMYWIQFICMFANLPPLQLWACSPDCFLSASLLHVFAKQLPSKCCFISSFPKFHKAQSISNYCKNSSVKAAPKCLFFSLTDLLFVKRAKAVFPSLSITHEQLHLIIYSALWGVRSHSSWSKCCQTVWIFHE